MSDKIDLTRLVHYEKLDIIIKQANKSNKSKKFRKFRQIQ